VVLFTTAGSPQALFGEAVGPCAVIVGCTGSVHLSGSFATITASLGQNAPVGILVQRIVRQRRVHHLLVLKVKTVGKVPLGNRRHGRLRIRWNLRVNGHRLRAGRYLITLRAFTKGHKVIARSRPIIIRIR
jgi:hypothetical protein